jgi:hypothetical protein
MKATFSSEMSVDFQRTTRGYIPEDGTLQNHTKSNLYVGFEVVVKNILMAPNEDETNIDAELL